MLAKSVLVLAALQAAAASPPGSNAPSEKQRFFLTCIGTMRAAGAPEMPITANGLVDIAGKRIAGFGVGSASILVLTDTLIGFASPAGARGDHVEGSLDRRTGKASIVVRSATEPGRELIAMELDCRPAPSVS
jgi:hypothetical protein